MADINPFLRQPAAGGDPPRSRGVFVSFEGADYSGKTTVIDALTAVLQARFAVDGT